MKIIDFDNRDTNQFRVARPAVAIEFVIACSQCQLVKLLASQCDAGNGKTSATINLGHPLILPASVSPRATFR